MSFLKGCSDTGTGCQGNDGITGSVKKKIKEICYLGTRVSSEYGSAQLRVGINYIRGVLQP